MGEQAEAGGDQGSVHYCFWHRPFLRFLSRALFIALYLLSLPYWGIELSWDTFLTPKNLLVFVGIKMFAKVLIGLTVAPVIKWIWRVDTFRDPNEPDWPWKKWAESRDKVVLSIVLFIAETLVFLILFALVYQIAFGQKSNGHEIKSMLVTYYISSGLGGLIWTFIDKAYFERFRLADVESA